jgi:hypothetical protein
MSQKPLLPRMKILENIFAGKSFVCLTLAFRAVFKKHFLAHNSFPSGDRQSREKLTWHLIFFQNFYLGTGGFWLIISSQTEELKFSFNRSCHCFKFPEQMRVGAACGCIESMEGKNLASKRA